MFVDSHCHLSFAGLHDRIDAVRADMAAARVDRALVISVSLEDFVAVQALAQRYDNFWATVGMHPDHEEGEEPTVERLVALAGTGRVVAIGETGLDYFRINGRSVAYIAWQRDRFRAQIRAARQTDYVNNFWRALAHDPALLRATWDRLSAVMAPGALDALVKELIYLAVSTANGCAYCDHSHTAAARAKTNPARCAATAAFEITTWARSALASFRCSLMISRPAERRNS